MNPDTEHRPANPPSDGFEERLLAQILADFDALTSAPAEPRRSTPRLRRASRGAQVAIAVPLVAAAVIAAAVTVASHGSTRDAGAVTAVRSHNTAYVVAHVRASLARLAVAGDGRVLERSSMLGDADDPLVSNVDWAYVDPRTRVAYQRSVDRSASGTVLSINKLVTTPAGDVLHTRVTFVDPSRHAYDVITDAPPAGTVTAAGSETLSASEAALTRSTRRCETAESPSRERRPSAAR